jgi:hypothetical protein
MWKASFTELNYGNLKVLLICCGSTEWLSGWGTELQTRRLQDRILMVSMEFFIDIIQPHYGPAVNSASNRNEYQEYFLWVKAASA